MKDTEFAKLSEFTMFGRSYTPLTSDAEEYLQSFAHKFEEHEYIFVPENDNALNLAEKTAEGESVYMSISVARDLSLHRNYMAFLKYIWDYMPDRFQEYISHKIFYKFLKHLKKQYKLLYSFKNESKKQEVKEQLIARKKEFKLTYKNIEKIAEMLGKSDMIEYISISFNSMDNNEFKEYVHNQLPFLYSDVLGRYYEGDQLKDMIETIETDFEKFFYKLEK